MATAEATEYRVPPNMTEAEVEEVIAQTGYGGIADMAIPIMRKYHSHPMLDQLSDAGWVELGQGLDRPTYHDFARKVMEGRRDPADKLFSYMVDHLREARETRDPARINGEQSKAAAFARFILKLPAPDELLAVGTSLKELGAAEAGLAADAWRTFRGAGVLKGIDIRRAFDLPLNGRVFPVNAKVSPR